MIMLRHPLKALKTYHIAVNVNKFFLIKIKLENKYNHRNKLVFLLIILLDAVLFFNCYLTKFKE